MKIKQFYSLAGLTILSFFTTQANAVIISSTDVPQAIPDLGVATSTLTAPNLGAITDLNLFIDDLRHTSILDLAIELTSPLGTVRKLIASYNDGGILSSLADYRVDLVGTIFDDEAAVNLLTGVTPAGNSPFPGSFNIDHAPTVGLSPLSVFDGENTSGVWSLRVMDELGGDSGTLYDWSLEFTASVPEPTTLALMGLGLAGIGWKRRKAA